MYFKVKPQFIFRKVSKSSKLTFSLLNIEHTVLHVEECLCMYHEMLIFLVAGIKCFSCNSHYDRNCGDPFSNYTTELVNCEQVSNRQTMIRLVKSRYFTHKSSQRIISNMLMLNGRLNIVSGRKIGMPTQRSWGTGCLRLIRRHMLFVCLMSDDDILQEDHRMTHLPLNGTERHTANICRKTVQVSRALIG